MIEFLEHADFVDGGVWAGGPGRWVPTGVVLLSTCMGEYGDRWGPLFYHFSLCEWDHGEAGKCGVEENINFVPGRKLRVIVGTEVIIPENDSSWFVSRHICRTFGRVDSIR